MTRSLLSQHFLLPTFSCLSSVSRRSPLSNFRAMATGKGDLSKAEHVSTQEIARGKWIALNNVTYRDPKGRERLWESVSRTTKQTNTADAVCVITEFFDPIQGCQCVILARQYRPPLKTTTIEFPAGLIDAGETAGQAAVREMKEETGYDVTIKTVSPMTALDTGVSNTTLVLVTSEMDPNMDLSKRPAPTTDAPDEFIEVIVQPTANLLNKLNEFSEAGDIVDARVYSWALSK